MTSLPPRPSDAEAGPSELAIELPNALWVYSGMLIELRIQNYAIIERLSLRLETGLNVFTGETGAGKSIIVGALSLLLGERASADVVRAGADRASVEGVFDIAHDPQVLGVLAEQGLEAEDGLLILRREVALEGRNRAWINGSAATAAFLGEVGRMLIDLHGQHESQTLLRSEAQRDILDAFASAQDDAAGVRAAHERLRAVRTRIEDLERRRREAEQRADYLRFQSEEIQRAAIRADEETLLEEEAARLEHTEELTRIAHKLYSTLYGSEQSLSAAVADLRRQLEHLLRIDASQTEAGELLDTAYYNLEEVGRRMGAYASSIESDPVRLDEIRTRQDLLFRLRSKYGPTLEDVLETGRRAQAELDLLDQAGFEHAELAAEERAARAQLHSAAVRLSDKRTSSGVLLEREAADLLPSLGLPGARFVVELTAHDETSATGAEGVAFLVAMNTGFEPRPLARVASGGELSRVMLVLKTILAHHDRVPTLIFDEVDVGIGGKVALQVGDRLRSVAEQHQVFVITHLAQIASRADHQLLVEKVEQEGTTLTRVGELHGAERVRELSRMLGGDPESAVSLEHARELLQARTPAGRMSEST